jgi:hypothetical protein
LRLAQVFAHFFYRRHWRTIRIGQIILHIPPDWGDVELDEQGDYIIHNRARRFRVDGDAVWYASAIELSIRSERQTCTAAGSAMKEITRTIFSSSGPIVLAMAIANGVPAKQRHNALRILRTARVNPAGEEIVWCEPPVPDRPEGAAGPFHPRIARSVRI